MFIQSSLPLPLPLPPPPPLLLPPPLACLAFCCASQTSSGSQTMPDGCHKRRRGSLL